MKSIKIGNTQIGPSEPPFIIAEMSANHNGSIENAFNIIDKAKDLWQRTPPKIQLVLFAIYSIILIIL